MRLAQRLLSLPLIGLLGLTSTPPAMASAYDGHPKLVVLVVIDQFREDYLERYRADFKAKNGFRLFLDHGAYFPDCYYDYANTKTASGHATLGTGAYTDGHGISANEWWDLDRSKDHPITSVEDERYRTVGLIHEQEGAVGASPLNERASTLGDELRLATAGRSRVYGVSLKDRAAILPAGHAANGAFWIDPDSGSFVSSTYYMNALPAWATAFNAGPRAQQALDEAHVTTPGKFFSQVGPTPAANTYEIDFAKALITNEQLGHHATTDMLTLSLSANDILGHQVGPDSPQERAMVGALDTELDSFFTWLDKNVDGGLANVWVALSADHGVAPTPVQAAALGMPAATFDIPKLMAALNDALNGKYSPGEKVDYLLSHQELPYLALNRPAFERAGVNEQEAEESVQTMLPAAIQTLPAQPPIRPLMAPPALPPTAPVNTPGARQRMGRPAHPARPLSKSARPLGSSQSAADLSTSPDSVAAAPELLQPPSSKVAPHPEVVDTYSRLLLASGSLPPDEFGQLIAHSYSPNGGWYVMIIPEAYQMGGNPAGTGTTHFSPWSYDRHVPLGFYGAPFTPGIYHGRVAPVDFAATFAALLGINQPSASVGHILTQAIRPVSETAAAARGKGHRRGSKAAGEASEGITGKPATETTPANHNPPPEVVTPAPINSSAPTTAPPAATPTPEAPTIPPPANTPPATAPPTATPPSTNAPPPTTTPPPATDNPPGSQPSGGPPSGGAVQP